LILAKPMSNMIEDNSSSWFLLPSSDDEGNRSGEYTSDEHASGGV